MVPSVPSLGAPVRANLRRRRSAIWNVAGAQLDLVVEILESAVHLDRAESFLFWPMRMPSGL